MIILKGENIYVPLDITKKQSEYVDNVKTELHRRSNGENNVRLKCINGTSTIVSKKLTFQVRISNKICVYYENVCSLRTKLHLLMKNLTRMLLRCFNLHTDLADRSYM